MRTLIAILVGALAAGSAHAQSSIACTVTMSSGLFSFGNIVPFSPAGVSGLLGEFIVRCANPGNSARNVRLRLAISAGSSGTATQRHMTRPGGTVPLLYNLYEDATYTTVWTANTGGRPDEVLNIPAGATSELRRQVFGRIPGRQTAVTVGHYSDALVAEVRY
jgi:spore coat protein U-like protein